eukprot:TRINITY_DN17912_c0_g1_i1.p1 TRINITY_DN17912_c0_g1~~TRINITY_DN17912_c0_g1_i1.p1  ORF type:complete len:226 (-),score=44.97 TRINITY_DN17912_c0_g1_i1:387-1064(-)
MDCIDFRSDTVTWPTPEMREAMKNAIVGDDVYGEDPTVNQLQKEAAEMFGKEAGLFVTSGTQGNLLAIMTHCARGEELICGESSHTFLYEAGGMSALAGVMPNCVPVQSDGTLLLSDITSKIRPDDNHYPITRLIIIENTQNKKGGVALTPEYTDSVGELAKEHGLKFHIDGARIFNAAAELNCSVKDLVRSADTITFCLSKGLCCPAGSILLGDKAFIKKSEKK